MKQFFKDLTAFTKRERRGTIILVVLILLVIIMNRNIDQFVENDPWYVPEDTLVVSKWLNDIKSRKLNLKSFNPNNVNSKSLIEMGLPASICSNWVKYLDAGGNFYNKQDVRRLYGMSDSIFYKLEPYIRIPASQKNYSYKSNLEKKQEDKHIFDFNPNLFSYDELIAAGLSKTIASNIINYRKSGGKFTVKSDLKKLYVIDEAIFLTIEPHIIITNKEEQVVKVDSVELNSTTFSELMSLGIPSRISKNIITYRKILGGYYSKSQLKEVYDMDSVALNRLSNSIWIDTLLIRRFDINEIDEYKLSRHPYISKTQARQILKYKRFANKIENFDEIVSLNIISKEMVSKLRVYFAF